MNARAQPAPDPSPAAVDDERQRYIDEATRLWEERQQRRTPSADHKARTGELGAPQPPPDPDPYAGMDGDLAKALRSIERHRRELAGRKASDEAADREDPQPSSAAPAASGTRKDKIANLPIIPTKARAVVNEIASSALFAAVQGKNRAILNDEPIAATGDTQIFFSGEQLNQDDHDVFMLLVFLASTQPVGEYITVSAHSLLKALGRTTGGPMHQQIDAEIKRLTKATVEIKNNRLTYIGHLIHDAVKHEKTKHWIYRLNEKLVSLYGASCYTLIDWEQRKRLRGKDLARWLQLEIARSAVPFPIKVETLRSLCGSQAKELRKYRQTLKAALIVLQAEGHIAAWDIDENDLLRVDRGAAITASQRRSLALPKPTGKKA